MQKLLIALVLVLTLSNCAIQKNINAANKDKIAMAVTLTNGLTEVSKTPTASDDMAMGFLIGIGAFDVQSADTFVDYMRGLGFFLRETIPWGKLLLDDNGTSMDGAIIKAGKNIFIGDDGIMSEGSVDSTRQIGNDQQIYNDSLNPIESNSEK